MHLNKVFNEQKTTMQPANINLSNPQLERQILGAVISYPHAAKVVFAVVGSGAFYHYNTLANVLQQMHNDGKPIDLITASEAARSKGIKMHEVSDIATDSLTPANIEYHCRILFQYALGRNLAQVAQKVQSDITNGLDPFEALEWLKNALKIDLPTVANNSYHLSDIKTVESIELTIAEGYKCFEMPWKYNDKYKMEFEYGNLVILAAGPSVGKTAFMLNICFHLAQRGTPVCIFNFESGMRKLKNRMISMFTGIGSEKIKRGLLNEVELFQIKEAVKTIDSMPIYANEKARDIISLEMEIRKLHERGVSLFFIDNLSNVTLPNADRMDLRIGAYLKELTRLKKDLNITICLLVHRARANEKNKGSKNSSLRNSGELEQDADQIIFLDALEGDEVEVDCTKDRDGAKWTQILEFNRSIQQFKNRTFGLAELDLMPEVFKFTPAKEDEIDF